MTAVLDAFRPRSRAAGGVIAPIALVITDVDGTLVTPDKVLTPAAAAAARRLAGAGVGLTLISSRPPRGLTGLVKGLDIRLPFGGFNGGVLSAPDQTPIETHYLAPDIARQVLAVFERPGVDIWVYAGSEWRMRDPHGAHVAHEQLTLGFAPTVVGDFDDLAGGVGKIVAVSDDAPLLARVEAEAKAALGDKAAIIRSQAAYLDVTHPLANKGDAVTALTRLIGVDLGRTAVIGDMYNDVAMFDRAAYAVAMGQAPDEVKARADAVTGANTGDGFAWAVDHLILPRALGAAP